MSVNSLITQKYLKVLVYIITMTKYKIICFPFHRPYQTRLFRTGHEFYIINDYGKNVKHRWVDNIVTSRDLPENAKLISITEFVSNQEKFDLIMLQTAEHIKHFSHITTIPKLFSWHFIGPVTNDIITRLGNKPIAICTSNNYKRDIDIVIPEGHDIKEFEKRNYDQEPIKEILTPVNRFKEIGNYITGYKWFPTIKQLNIKVIGKNKALEQIYKNTKLVDYKTYKSMIASYMAIFQPSSIKARSFVVGETMASKNIVIISRPRTFKYNSSLLENGKNAFFVNTPQELIKMNDNLKNDKIPKKELQQIGENALQTIDKHLPIDKFIDNWKEFIETSLNN